MSKKDKNKATKSAKVAKDAIKGGKAKLVEETPKPIVVSEFARPNENPKWNAQLDALREADLAAGMTEKSARVQRDGRIRLLKAGKPLPETGGLMELDHSQLELTLGEPTAPPVPESMKLDIATASNEELTVLEESVKLSKKERKALAKLQAAAFEVQQEAIAEAGEDTPTEELTKKQRKQLAKEQAVVAVQAVTKKAALVPVTRDQVIALEEEVAQASVAEPAEAQVKRTRQYIDHLHIALQEAQEKANEIGKKQLVHAPRQYSTKNYGVRLVEKYIAEFPGLSATDVFDEETNKFAITLKVSPQK